jgi:20S proteasome alpha/beta subunit
MFSSRVLILQTFFLLVLLSVPFSRSQSWKSTSASNKRYDKSISLFSPEGDLLQVRYADNAGANGLSLVCIATSENSVVLCSPSLPSSSLMDRRCVDKVSMVDEGIWIAFAGILGDGRHVTRKARQFCRDYNSKFRCKPSVAALAHHIGSIQHEASIKGGERPLGLHVLCVGFDDGEDNNKSGPPLMFISKSSGEVTQWKATAIGKNSDKVFSLLEDKIGSSISEQEAIHTAGEVLGSAQVYLYVFLYYYV